MGADGQLQLRTASGASNSSTTNEAARKSVERVDVTVVSNGQIKLEQLAPRDGESATGIMLVEVQQQQSGLQIEIADFRRNQVAQYRATLPDGSDLPPSIQVDSSTGKVTLDASSTAQLIQLHFIAQDKDGSIQTLEIKLDLRVQGSQLDKLATPPGISDARPAFTHQLAIQQQQWDGYGEKLLSVFTE